MKLYKTYLWLIYESGWRDERSNGSKRDPCELFDTSISRKWPLAKLKIYVSAIMHCGSLKRASCGVKSTVESARGRENERMRENKNKKEEKWVGEYCARETDRWTCIDMRFKVHARAGSALGGGEGGSSHLHRRRHAEWQSKARRPAAINNVTPPKI